MRGVLATPRGQLRFRSPLLGRYNLSNLLAAAAAAEALGLPIEAVAARHRGDPSARRAHGARCAPGRPSWRSSTSPTPTPRSRRRSARCASSPGTQGGGGLRLRRRPGPGQASADGQGRGRARRSADRHLRQSAQRGSAGDPGARSRRGSRRAPTATTVSCPTAGRRSGARWRWRWAAAGPFWWPARGTRTTQIVGNQRLPFSDREELERAIAEHAAAPRARG